MTHNTEERTFLDENHVDSLCLCVRLFLQQPQLLPSCSQNSLNNSFHMALIKRREDGGEKTKTKLIGRWSNSAQYEPLPGHLKEKKQAAI